MDVSRDRWAIYFAPPTGSPLWERACRWLGRDPEDGRRFEAPADLDAEEWEALVAAPRRYGFHATLKPPFRLRPEASPDDLLSRVAELTRTRRGFQAPPLQVSRIGRFLALTPSAECPALETLAADCVRLLDGLRSPPTGSETERRRHGGMTRRQEALLRRWGYPYVFDEFRFHMTLTGSLDEHRLPRVREMLEGRFSDVVGRPMPVDGIAVFHQPGSGSELRLEKRFPFG